MAEIRGQVFEITKESIAEWQKSGEPWLTFMNLDKAADLVAYIQLLERDAEESEATIKSLRKKLAAYGQEERCYHLYWKQTRTPKGEYQEVCRDCGADVSNMDGMGS